MSRANDYALHFMHAPNEYLCNFSSNIQLIFLKKTVIYYTIKSNGNFSVCFSSTFGLKLQLVMPLKMII